MTNCNNCASICCIAPYITNSDENQGRGSGEVIKDINTRCKNLCSDGGCGIYNKRSSFYVACINYDCKGFGPLLTEYCIENNLFHSDGTLKEKAFDIFCLLNQMMSRTFCKNIDHELRDALQYYNEHKDWPSWMLTEEYADYLYGRRIFPSNPRFDSQEKKTQVTHHSGVIQLFGKISKFFQPLR